MKDIRRIFLAELEKMEIEGGTRALEEIYLPLAERLADWRGRHRRGRVVGVCGAQGSGKTTFCRLLKSVLEECHGMRVATVSIDDIYNTRAQRMGMAEKIHPLLITRGVPGTHDVAMGLSLLEKLRNLGAGERIAVPGFDKAMDDRLPKERWEEAEGPVDIVLFEGWCVGAAAQEEEELARPVNVLESEEDKEGGWRRYVNAQLAGEYASLFSELDLLILLKIPGFSHVQQWRTLQERKLAASSDENNYIMGEAALMRFIMHYERITRAILKEMPARADLVLPVNEAHQICGIEVKPGALAK